MGQTKKNSFVGESNWKQAPIIDLEGFPIQNLVEKLGTL